MAAAQNRRARRRQRLHDMPARSCPPQGVTPGTAPERIPGSPPMPGYARFIGRVGALAVALGVGVAVASSYGAPVAQADDTTQTSNDKPSDSPSNDDNTDTNNDNQDNDNDNDNDDNEDDGDGEDGQDEQKRFGEKLDEEQNAGVTENQLGQDGGPGNDETKLGGDGLGLEATDAENQPLVDPPVEVPPPVDVTPPVVTEQTPEAPKPPVEPVTPPPAVDPVVHQNEPATTNVPESKDVQPSGEQLLDREAPVEFTVEQLDGADNRLTAFTSEDAQTFSTLIAPEPNIIEPEQPDIWAGLATIPGVAARLAYTVTAAFLSPFLVGGPTAPVQPPVLWAVLAWVRREFQRTLFNETPTAVDDTSITTSEDVSVDISALLNDVDTDEDPLTVTDYTQPENGTVTYDPVTKKFTYTPDENFHGTDTFQYAVSDHAGAPHWHGPLAGLFNVGHQDVATVTVTVTAVNDIPVADDSTISTDEDTPFSGTLTGSDADNDTLTYAIGTPPAHGTITNFNPTTGAYTYNPNQDLDDGETRDDTFTFTVSDGTATSEAATVTVTVTGINDAPDAVNDVASTTESAPTTGNALANDSDADGDSLTVTTPGTQAGTYGSITINPDGSYTYTPGQAGQVLGPNGGTIVLNSPSQVTQGTYDSTYYVDGNKPYVAFTFVPSETGTYVFEQVDIPRDTTLIVYEGAFDPSNEAANLVAIDDDSGPGLTPRVTVNLEAGQTYTIVNSTYGTGGNLSLPLSFTTDGPGVAAGVPIDPNTLDDGETATDTFSYTVTDGDETDTATITVTINGSNDAPVAVNDNAGTVGEDSTTGVTYNVVANDTDIDGEALSVGSVTQGQYGTVTYTGGTVTYTPNAGSPTVQGLGVGETLADTFTYFATDGDATSATAATVTVTIVGANDDPVATDDTITVTEDQPITFTSAGLTANDTDADGDPLVAGIVAPANGTLSVSNGVYTYTPASNPQVLDAGESITETFTYLVSDGNGGFDSATVTVVINGVNDAPVANPDNAGTIAEDSTTPLTYNVVANDTDIDDEPLTISSVTQGQYGTVTYTGGSINYVLNNAIPAVQALGTNGSMTDTFTYTVYDGTTTSQGTVTVTITGVNDAPVITVVDPGTPDSETGIINGSVTATDVDGGSLTYSVPNTDTTYGSVSINPQTGQFVYTPDNPVPSSAIAGTDFEGGTLAGWNVGSQTGTYDSSVDGSGDGVAITTGSLTFSSPARENEGVPAREWVYTPDGQAAVLSPQGAQTFTQAMNELGLTAAQQQAIISTSAGTPTDAAWITKTVHLEAGKTYTMSWNYIGTDYQPYNDGSITTLVPQGSGPVPTVEVNGYQNNYAILGYTNTGTGDYSTGSYGSTGWQTSTYRVSETGNYTLGFAVFNLTDSALDPVLLVDSEGGTTLRDGQLYAPVPPNSPVAPKTLDDTFTVNVSDGNGGTDSTEVTVQVTVIGAPQTPTV